MMPGLAGENGEGGIRTHGSSRYTRFQVERIRPLCHLSKVFNIIASLGRFAVWGKGVLGGESVPVHRPRRDRRR